MARIIFNENNDVVLIDKDKKITYVRYSEPIVELVDPLKEINYNIIDKEK